MSCSHVCYLVCSLPHPALLMVRREAVKFKVLADMLDLISVAHPDFSLNREVLEQLVIRRDFADFPSIFSRRGAFDFALQMITGKVHAVTNSQHRHTKLENGGRDFRRHFQIDRFGAARKKNQTLAGMFALGCLAIARKHFVGMSLKLVWKEKEGR